MKTNKQNQNDYNCQYIRLQRENLITVFAQHMHVKPCKPTTIQQITIRNHDHFKNTLLEFFPKNSVLRAAVLAKQQGLISTEHYYHEEEPSVKRTIEWFNITQLSKYLPILPYYERSPHIATQNISNSLREAFKTAINNLELHSSSLLLTELNIMYIRGIKQHHDRNFTITNKGIMTYLPANKPCTLSSNNKWAINHRRPIKFGRAIKKIFSQLTIPDQDVEKLNNQLKSNFCFSGTFIKVTGYDIWEHYKEDSYAPNQGSLNQSCMKYQACYDYLNLYYNNPELVSLLAAINSNGATIGRALIWKCDDGSEYMDRIYGNDITVEAFKDYARLNGIAHKVHQSYNDRTFVQPNGEIINSTQEITLMNSSTRFDGEEGRFPYMDTFKYTDATGLDFITLTNDEGDICLDSTEGGPHYEYYETSRGMVEDFNARFCKHSRKWAHANDAIYINPNYIHFDDIVTIEGQRYDRHDDRVTRNLDGTYKLK